MQTHLWDPGHGSEDNVFNAGLSGRGHGDGIAIATQAGGDPENVDFWNRP
jgi:hypothetical protein